MLKAAENKKATPGPGRPSRATALANAAKLPGNHAETIALQQSMASFTGKGTFNELNYVT
jgi:hypothetical protein